MLKDYELVKFKLLNIESLSVFSKNETK